MKDLLDASNRGRWWLVGAAWSGRGNEDARRQPLTQPVEELPLDHELAKITGQPSVDLVKLAAKQRMNTGEAVALAFAPIFSPLHRSRAPPSPCPRPSQPRFLRLASQDIRRKIFYVIMSSEDYVDAVDKLMRLKLKGRQEREVVRVLLDCCVQQRVYNPYFSLVARKLCTRHGNHRLTLQYAIWDRFKVGAGG